MINGLLFLFKVKEWRYSPHLMSFNFISRLFNC